MSASRPRTIRPSRQVLDLCPSRARRCLLPAGEIPPVSDAWVYLLRCRDDSLYTGWTSDLERRLERHQAGKGSRYTASRLPVELALALPMADRTAARREEARIKLLTRADKLELIAASRPVAADRL
jgi:putative endonuclease